MDLIRIFAGTAFVHVCERYLDCRRAGVPAGADELMIDEAMFVDECRRSHPELTDDQIRMIYYIYKDEWSYPCNYTFSTYNTGRQDGAGSKPKVNRHIFNVVIHIAQEFLRVIDNKPKVKFHHLFRWRELTQIMGEDIFACAVLAWHNKDRDPYDFNCHGAPGAAMRIKFTEWPTVLHNDNPELLHIFKSVGLCELHSHLRASTDNFGITWVCLMNHINGRGSQFERLAKIQDPSRYTMLADKLYAYTAKAASIRLHLWRYLQGELDHVDSVAAVCESIYDLKALDGQLALMRRNDLDLDYISDDPDRIMNVFAGERMFLYAMFERIIRTDNIILYELFYNYILLKNRLRSFLVQVNDNRGFNNFKRFQDLKSVFLRPNYGKLLLTVPMWEARHFNYAKSYEARIIPPDEVIGFREAHRAIESVLTAPEKQERFLNWTYIFHFIKIHDRNIADYSARDSDVRRHTAKKSSILKRLLQSDEFNRYITGIDAASAEIACRPEAFAQVFRHLKAVGYSATFHVGEDFYDIADGLRAIFEAVTFLDLESGDRLGHAIALGIDPHEFYAERHRYIALPSQWMLDNIVWLYFYAREHNVEFDSQTENFILCNARNLMVEIGYENACGGMVDLYDYYQSMLLRGDNPEAYREEMFNPSYAFRVLSDGTSWSSFNITRNTEIKKIRQQNAIAAKLYSIYHFDSKIKRAGRCIKSFQVPEGYVTAIAKLQCCMIKEISRLKLGIECCPSSNLKIGRLHRFDRHPIFRFMPIKESESRYPLAVTVNTDDLGIFATSLPNEFSLLTLALVKCRDAEGNRLYSSREVYEWIKRVVENGHMFRFMTLDET